VVRRAENEDTLSVHEKELAFCDPRNISGNSHSGGVYALVCPSGCWARVGISRMPKCISINTQKELNEEDQRGYYGLACLDRVRFLSLPNLVEPFGKFGIESFLYGTIS